MAAEFYLAHEEFTDGIAAIEDDSPAGADVRQRLGEALVRDVGAMFRTNGMQLGYRYEDSRMIPSTSFPRRDRDRAHLMCGLARAARPSISLDADLCCFALAPILPTGRRSKPQRLNATCRSGP